MTIKKAELQLLYKMANLQINKPTKLREYAQNSSNISPTNITSMEIRKACILQIVGDNKRLFVLWTTQSNFVTVLEF